MFPDDSQKDLGTVLSYMAGRMLGKEEIFKAMGLPRSTYYDRLEKGTLITADNLRTVATNLRINRAELLTRYRLIDPEEVESLAEQISGQRPLPPSPSVPSEPEVITHPATTGAAEQAAASHLAAGHDGPPSQASSSTDLVTIVATPP